MDDRLKGGHGRGDVHKDVPAVVQEDMLSGAVAVELKKRFEVCSAKRLDRT